MHPSDFFIKTMVKLNKFLGAVFEGAKMTKTHFKLKIVQKFRQTKKYLGTKMKQRINTCKSAENNGKQFGIAEQNIAERTKHQSLWTICHDLQKSGFPICYE